MTNTFRHSTKIPFHIDYPLVFILLALTAVSLTAIYGSIPLLASSVNGTDLLIKQVVWIGISVAVLVTLIILGIDRILTSIYVFYWIMIGLLILLLLDKVVDLPFIYPINGTRAWIVFPGLGSVQPSEFMKIVLIIICSDIIHKHNQLQTEFSLKSDLMVFLKVAQYAVLPLFLIILQPDTGIPIVIVIGILIMLAISGIKIEWVVLVSAGVIGLLGLLLFLFFSYPSILVSILGSSYRLNRLYGWLQTENFISSWGLQLYQSLLAVGSAGLSGHGWQSHIISIIEPQNDFIFAVFSQDFGFIGSSLIIALELALDVSLIRIALRYKGNREKLLVAGIIGMLAFQQVQNMGMIIGLLPITGITLPFISAGGSSLLSYMPAIAIIFYMSSINRTQKSF
ncbi:MAG: FtsW/RodA/SpoVE family cell cycle protein [Erysipelotrichaceae bacterium]